MSSKPLAFVDLETTGATATADRITEIGIVEVDERGVREWSQLVDPQTAIPGFIQNMTGITDAMVAGQPTFADLAAELLQRLQGRIFIAHNARFDYGFLKNEFRRAGYDFRASVLCTVKLSRRLYPQQRKHNLDALIERHQLQVEGRHRALADAQLIHQFWQQMQQQHDPALLAGLVAELTGRSSLPPHLDAEIVDLLPEEPGVYLFYGENALPLYVGKAKEIRARVLSHFAGDHASAKEMALSQQLRRIEWIVCGGEIGALLQEAALIKKLQPSHNRRLRRNDEICALRLIDHGGGWLKPERITAAEMDFGRNPGLYGPFKSAKEASDTLTALAEAHGLCHALLGLEKVAPGKPCFAHQLRKCRGACVGKEPLTAHAMRLVQALSRLRLRDWPCAGPGYIREGDQVHLVDAWCYLGSAKAEEELHALLDQGPGQFDRDTYRILSKVAGQIQPLRR